MLKCSVCQEDVISTQEHVQYAGLSVVLAGEARAACDIVTSQ